MKHPLPLSQWLNPTRPDETCIAWLGTREWQLGELRHDVVTLMQALHTQPGTRWALCFENSYLFIVALLATLHAGKIPVIPGHCRASVLNEQQDLFDGILSEASLDCAGPQIVVSAGSASTHGHDITLPPIAADSVIELFTSGSTGQPKKIIKPVALLDAEAQMLHTRFEQRLDGCRVVASVVPQHLYGLTFRIFLPMACGLPCTRRCSITPSSSAPCLLSTAMCSSAARHFSSAWTRISPRRRSACFSPQAECCRGKR